MKRVRAVYLEYRDKTSEKFYCAYVCDGRGLVHWGRIGTRGQSQVVAQSEAYRRIGEKRRKYTLVWDGRFDFDREWNQQELSHALSAAMYNGTGKAQVHATERTDREQEAVFVW